MKKIISVLVVLFAIIISVLADAFFHKTGELSYISFPFPIQVDSCGSAIGTVCSYPYVWWGILLSVIFWAVIIGIAYIVGKKRKAGIVIKS
jgi:hypothetical protein